MKVHTLIVRLLGVQERIPHYLGGRAAVLLRCEYPEGRTRNWIDPGASRLLSDDLLLLEIIAPNHVETDAVISAVNQAVASEMRDIKSHQWETLLFSSVYCMNQDQ